MMLDKNSAPFRHPYGDCVSNIPINKLIQAGLPYYPIFAYSFTFEFTQQTGRILGDSVAVSTAISGSYWDSIYRVYGIECEFEDKDENKDEFFSKIRKLLESSSVPCLIDCYYDPSTEYANVYQKEHQAHGRMVTEIDSEFVYYYATHVADSSERFYMSLDDFYLACEKIMYFRFPASPKTKEERHFVLKEILLEWFIENDYERMFEHLGSFSEALRSSSSLGDEIDHQFQRNRVPVSKLFGKLVLICQSRGAAIVFLQGYMGEFGNNAYQAPIQRLVRSLELWNDVKSLLVKYGMAPKQSIQESMANYLLEIRNIEEEAVELLRNVIYMEMDNNIK